MTYIARYETTEGLLSEKPSSTKCWRLEKSTNLLNP